MPIPFKIVAEESACKARVAELTTAHGSAETPLFMPVGTIGTVKTASPADLLACDVQVMLSNTYHLYLRPGCQVLESFGGLHRFNGWQGPILTDSGGFQIYSLDDLKKVSEEGVEFKSHLDGSRHLFTPERVVDIQRSIGSDIMMILDYLTGNPSDYQTATDAHRQTLRWAARGREQFDSGKESYGYPQYQFAIVQGGIYEDLRRESVAGLVDIGFDGYAIGGLAVGEDAPTRYRMTDICTEALPPELPRYLMGVGKPEDILDGIELGVDMFDCVIPSRNARNGSIFTSGGKINIRNARFRDDHAPLDEQSPLALSQSVSRGYLHHLFKVNEMLGLRVATMQNVQFYQQLTSDARRAIRAGRFMDFKNNFLSNYYS